MRKPIVWWLSLGLMACGSGAAVPTDTEGSLDAAIGDAVADVAGPDIGGPAADPGLSTPDADDVGGDLVDAPSDAVLAVASCVGCHTDKARLLASLTAEPPAGSEAGCSGEGEG